MTGNDRATAGPGAPLIPIFVLRGVCGLPLLDGRTRAAYTAIPFHRQGLRRTAGCQHQQRDKDQHPVAHQVASPLSQAASPSRLRIRTSETSTFFALGFSHNFKKGPLRVGCCLRGPAPRTRCAKTLAPHNCAARKGHRQSRPRPHARDRGVAGGAFCSSRNVVPTHVRWTRLDHRPSLVSDDSIEAQ